MDLYFVLLSLIRTFAPKTTTMKKTLLSFWLLIMVASVSAQTIVKGDMNGDGELTITDAVKVVNVILGNAPKQAIDLDDPYRVDNTLVVGTWYAPGVMWFEFNEDGTYVELYFSVIDTYGRWLSVTKYFSIDPTKGKTAVEDMYKIFPNY